jgi:hypothetical protein
MLVPFVVTCRVLPAGRFGVRLRNYRAKNHRFHARLFINVLDSLGRLINRKKRRKKKTGIGVILFLWFDIPAGVKWVWGHTAAGCKYCLGAPCDWVCIDSILVVLVLQFEKKSVSNEHSVMTKGLRFKQ